MHVRILVSVESNNKPADAALRHEYGRMLEAGVEVWEYVNDDQGLVPQISVGCGV